MIVLARLFPCVALLILGKPGASVLALLLQLTVIGWFPASEWALMAIEERQDQERLQRAMFRRRQHRAVGRV